MPHNDWPWPAPAFAPNGYWPYPTLLPYDQQAFVPHFPLVFDGKVSPQATHCYEYPRPAVTVDIAVFTSRFATEDEWPRVLLIKRGKDPYEGYWALPGGFLNMDETGDSAAKRELQEETGLDLDKIRPHFLGIQDKPDRDPRGRVISLAYAVMVPEMVTVKGSDDAREAEWVPLPVDRPLAFDHEAILEQGIRWLAEKRHYPYEYLIPAFMGT